MSRLRETRDVLLGTAFLGAAVLFVVFCVGAYNGAFSSKAMVELRIEESGLQLLRGSDVKVRGIVVGSVEQIRSDGSGAAISLALEPSSLRLLPADVSARLVPKTLFGEKYVDLVLPEAAAHERLQAGDVIPEDRSAPTLEINRVLDDLLPLLRAVPPEDLNSTLSALASALDGRGDQLGETLVQLDGYLKGINPQLPQLRRDLVAFTEVADIYDRAAPDLLATLDNLSISADTLVEERDAFAGFLSELTGAADSARGLLTDTEQDLVRVNEVNRETLGLLAEYSPMFDCFFKGYKVLSKRIELSAVDGLPHIIVEFGAAREPYEYPKDLPEYADTRGPECYGLPDPARPTPEVQFQDGTDDDDAPAGGSASTMPGSAALRPVAVRERAQVDALLAPTLGVQHEDVPDIGGLLWTPLVAGTRVSLS